VPDGTFRLGGIEVTPALVQHSGTTLGYRLAEGDASCCYLPDHEPGRSGDLARLATDTISGHELARGASLLIHDAQYSDSEYLGHRGWGHSSFADALTFARRSEAQHVTLFHHDPDHDDDRVDAIAQEAAEIWTRLGNGSPMDMAREGMVFDLS
jgi:phosphoribosyl 1,2-cyclic phosphodiesterase